MDFGDLLRKGLKSLGKNLKESYDNGSLGDNVLRGMIEAKEKSGKYYEAEKIKQLLRKRIMEREQKR